MKEFFKYLALGLLGLSLTLALPALPVNWAALVLTQVYLSEMRRLAAGALLLAIALAYSAFSLDSALSFAAPWALAWIFCLALRRPFHWDARAERALLLLLLTLFPILSGGLVAWIGQAVWLPDVRDWLSLLLTFGIGFFAAPLLSRVLARLWSRLASFLLNGRGADLSRADWLSARNSRSPRKPFGLEKGL